MYIYKLLIKHILLFRSPAFRQGQASPDGPAERMLSARTALDIRVLLRPAEHFLQAARWQAGGQSVQRQRIAQEPSCGTHDRSARHSASAEFLYLHVHCGHHGGHWA